MCTLWWNNSCSQSTNTAALQVTVWCVHGRGEVEGGSHGGMMKVGICDVKGYEGMCGVAWVHLWCLLCLPVDVWCPTLFNTTVSVNCMCVWYATSLNTLAARVSSSTGYQ